MSATRGSISGWREGTVTLVTRIVMADGSPRWFIQFSGGMRYPTAPDAAVNHDLDPNLHGQVRYQFDKWNRIIRIYPR